MRISIILYSFLMVSCSIPWGKKIESHERSERAIDWKTTTSYNQNAGPKGSISLKTESGAWLLRENRPVNFKSLPRQHWDQWGIPRSADAAALGYWAGYGEVIYAQRIGHDIAVYYREVEEQMEPQPFTRIKRINAPLR